GFRAVVSCTLVPNVRGAGTSTGLSARQPRVVVIDIRPDAGHLTAQISDVDLGGRSDEVHAMQPLPDRADMFAVGLATDSAPIGRLGRSHEGWRLEPFPDRAARSPDKAPTRALAVAVDDTRAGYLVVAG